MGFYPTGEGSCYLRDSRERRVFRGAGSGVWDSISQCLCSPRGRFTVGLDLGRSLLVSSE